MTNNTLQSFRQKAQREDVLPTEGLVAYDIHHTKEMLQMEDIINSKGVFKIHSQMTPMEAGVLLDSSGIVRFSFHSLVIL
jgi:hypothetical protein